VKVGQERRGHPNRKGREKKKGGNVFVEKKASRFLGGNEERG